MNKAYLAHTLSAVAAAGNTVDLPNHEGRGVQFGVNITAVGGSNTPSITVTIQGKDEASGEYYDLLVSAVLTATGFVKMTVYPGVTAVANLAASQVVPRVFRAKWVVAGTLPVITGTFGACVLV